jgi:hypothetical protein
LSVLSSSMYFTLAMSTPPFDGYIEILMMYVPLSKA